MSNSKMTKRALLTSFMALMLCFAMLTGTTFAWFTDQETSGNNKIVAGNLDVELLMFNGSVYEDISKTQNPIFGAENSLIAQNKNENTLWEPGKTQIAYLAVRNAGNLALKYNVVVDVEDGGLVDALEYAIIPMTDAATSTTALGTNWTAIKALPGVDSGDLEEKEYVAAPNGCLDEVRNGYDPEKLETDYFALAIHMKEEADNKFMSKPGDLKSVTINITVNATQVEAEADAFGDDYDEGAELIKLTDWTDHLVLNSDLTRSNMVAEEYVEIAHNSGNLTLENVTFKNGLTIYTNNVDNNGTVTMRNCTIYLGDGTGDPNYASNGQHRGDYGLNLNLANGSDIKFVFENCTFTAAEGHTYTTDGGYNVYIGGGYSADSIMFTNCTFENSGKHAIGCSSAGDSQYYALTVTGCNFVNWNNNPAVTNGAAIRGNLPAADFNANITISNNTFGNNNGSTQKTVAIDSWTGTWN